MAVRSVWSIDMRDGPFREFAKLFDKYEKALKSTPAAWKLVEKNIDGSKESFSKLVEQMAAANVQAKLREKAQERADQLTRTSADRWQSMARNTREFASNIGEATQSLLRWASVTGVISGLIGAGGLFGIDRMAMGVAQNRRSALGNDTTIGRQKAFASNFGRLVDPESFLGNVAGAKFDVTKRVGLISAGISPHEIAGDTAQTAVTLLRRLKQIADGTNPALFAQVLQARKLDQFASPTDLQRLRGTSPAEFERLASQYGQRSQQFDLPPGVAERWQDFVTQMTNAGNNIETVFVKGLVGLAPGLTKLSQSVEGLIAAAGNSPTLKRWIDDAGTAIEKFATYIGKPEFAEDVKTLVDGVGRIAGAIRSAGSWLGQNSQMPTVSITPGSIADRVRKMFGGMLTRDPYDSFSATPSNNPGNLRPPGNSNSFRRFDSPEDGVRAMARQLLLDQYSHGQNTIREIIGGNKQWPGYSATDAQAYIGNVSRRTGIGADQKLNLSDSNQLATVISAMISQEQRKGSYDKYKDAKVVVQIIKPAGMTVESSVNGVRGD